MELSFPVGDTYNFDLYVYQDEDADAIILEVCTDISPSSGMKQVSNRGYATRSIILLHRIALKNATCLLSVRIEEIMYGTGSKWFVTIHLPVLVRGALNTNRRVFMLP